MSTSQMALGTDGALVGARGAAEDRLHWDFSWKLEKWHQDKVDAAVKSLLRQDVREVQLTHGHGHCLVPVKAGQIGSDKLLEVVGVPDEILVIEGNLLLNEGIQRLLDLLIGAGGTTFANANAYIGVGDTNTAAAATQTELQATQNAANRFYKGMVATWPQRTNQTVDWKSDFTTGEANFAWAEWTIAAGATTASGSGFLVGTTNLNRKVESLGTKVSGTWTLTGSVTIS